MKPETLHRDGFFNRLRQKEYARLDETGQVYLDYTGGNLYPQSLIDQHYGHLKKFVCGNPHSNNPTAQLSGRYIAEARAAVLCFFKAADYECIFTANASGALQIVGECYPFSPESHLLLTADNHNSVNGIRQYCKRSGGAYSYCPMHKKDLTINEAALMAHLNAHAGKKRNLFAFPAQSNASGVKHSLAWVHRAQERGWDALLDAAAFVPGSPLDLSQSSPDFVALSFYKIFGYPTGIGCLLVKKSTFGLLQKRWFAGGTVSLASVCCRKHVLLQGAERFENGTVNYLDLPAITNGLRFINGIGMDVISRRLHELTGLLLHQLRHLRHGNGRPLVRLYGPGVTVHRGATLLMNFFDPDGRQYATRAIEDRANEKGISLRTGCFCNPGIDELASRVPAGRLHRYFNSQPVADAEGMMQFLGKARGAVRVSLGLPTTTVDLARFTSFAETFIDKPAPNPLVAAGQRAHRAFA